MVNLCGFKEMVKLELFLPCIFLPTGNPNAIDSEIEILQASECHKDCKCKYKCGYTKMGNCWEFSPPKRFL